MNGTGAQTCTAKLRPFRPINETELRCLRADEHAVHQHRTVLLDYAYPDSASTITWREDDRRTFRGDFVECTAHRDCVLPSGHRGDCAR